MKGNMNIKKLICVALVMIICTGLSSCSSTDQSLNQTDYKIEYENYSAVGNNGNYYISFKDSLEESEDSEAIPYLTFSSIKEFKDTVLGGKLTEQQIRTINSFAKNEAGEILTCNLNNLQTPKLPKGVSASNVNWGGQFYYFSLSANDGASGTLGDFTYNKDAYNNYLSDYEKVLNSDNITISKTELLDGDKTVIYYSNLAGSFKRVRYSLYDGNKTLIIDKEFVLQINHSLLNVSETVPSRVSLYCVDGEKSYIIRLYDLTEDPSDEWLLDFGLTKYVETETE